MTLSYTFNVSLHSLAMPQPLVMSDAIGGDETASVASSTVESVEKRTRFSFSHGDHDSIDAGKQSYGFLYLLKRSFAQFQLSCALVSSA